MSLVAAKNFLKFKEAVRRAYSEFTTTRDALADRRDRQSMWFNSIQDLSLSSDFNFYFWHRIKWQCNSLLCCAPWTTFDTFRPFITFTKSYYATTTALSRRVCPACSTVIKSDRRDALSTHEKSPLSRRLFPRRARSRPNPSTRHILIYPRALECDLEP